MTERKIGGWGGGGQTGEKGWGGTWRREWGDGGGAKSFLFFRPPPPPPPRFCCCFLFLDCCFPRFLLFFVVVFLAESWKQSISFQEQSRRYVELPKMIIRETSVCPPPPPPRHPNPFPAPHFPTHTAPGNTKEVEIQAGMTSNGTI